MLTALTILVLAADPRPFQWDVPEAIDRTEIAGGVRVGGAPVAMEVVVSRWPIDRLIQHFANRFQAAGLFIARKQRSAARQPILTGFDPKSRKTYSVVFDEGPGRNTTVVLGEVRWAEQTAHKAGDIAPTFPGAEAVIRSEDEGARILAFQARAKVEEVDDYYARVLGSNGYQRGEKGVFRRGADELSLTTRALGDGRVHVMIFARWAGPLDQPSDSRP